MPKKAASLLAALIALCGVALAVFIPAASAAKANATSTCGTYSECVPPTTTTTASTPTVTSSSPANPAVSSLTQAQAYTYLANLPGVSVSPGQVVTVTSVNAGLPVGISLAPGVRVLANGQTLTGASYVILDDAGTVVSAPYLAQLSVTPQGLVFINENQLAQDIAGHRAHAVRATSTLEQYVILPRGSTSRKFSYLLPAGVGFRKPITWAKVAAYEKVFAITNPAALAKAPSALKARATGHLVAANKGRTAFTQVLNRAQKSYAMIFSLRDLTYSRSLAAKIKTGRVTKLTTTFSVYWTRSGKLIKSQMPYSYVP